MFTSSGIPADGEDLKACLFKFPQPMLVKLRMQLCQGPNQVGEAAGITAGSIIVWNRPAKVAARGAPA